MFGKFLRQVSSRQFLGLSLIFLLIFLSLGTFLYWRNAKTAEKGQILATQQRSLVLARAGALAISQFLTSRKSELLLLAQHPIIASLSDKEAARGQLEVLVDSLSQMPVADIARIDKEGKVALVINKERITQGEGVDVSDREYFIWAKEAKNRGKFFVGEPLFPRSGAHQKELVIIMATPTYFNDQFSGVILFGLLASGFTEKYVLPLRIHEKTHALLVTDKGILIGGEMKELLGKNLIDYAKEREWSGWESYPTTLTKAAEAEGAGEWFFAAPGEAGPTREIVAFTPIKIDGAKMALLIANPEEVVGSLLPEFSQNQILLLGLIAVTLLVLGVFWDVSLHLARRDGFLDGVKNGYVKGKNDGTKKA